MHKFANVDCFIGEVFLGARAYADDCPSGTHPQSNAEYAGFCDKFASEYHVVFNTKKSKCLYINSCANRSRISATLPHFSIGGNHIAFVDEWPHLGHIITTNRDITLVSPGLPRVIVFRSPFPFFLSTISYFRVSSYLSGGSLVRGFTCPEVQTRNPTQPRVREKVKDYG